MNGFNFLAGALWAKNCHDIATGHNLKETGSNLKVGDLVMTEDGICRVERREPPIELSRRQYKKFKKEHPEIRFAEDYRPVPAKPKY